jgi:L,D-transpeptidase ErfK/SrfK
MRNIPGCYFRIQRERRLTYFLLLAFSIGFCSALQGETFPLSPDSRESIVGRVRVVFAKKGEALIDIGSRFDLGYNQIVKPNHKVNRWLPPDGTQIIIPSEYILPDGPREGIVINIAELRMYYYPKDKGVVETYPISIGRLEWNTPMGKTKVIKKDKNPAWYPPASIKAEHAADGDPLPDVIPGGDPENPLGGYALRLGLPGYLIHGTDERKAMGIGMRVTHGCIRMFPSDIETLFTRVAVGTPVFITNQPIKVAWEGDKIYVQITTPLKEDEDYFEITPEEAFEAIAQKVGPGALVSRKRLEIATKLADGMLVEVGKKDYSYPKADSNT